MGLVKRFVQLPLAHFTVKKIKSDIVPFLTGSTGSTGSTGQPKRVTYYI
jgi:hypothetical protein